MSQSPSAVESDIRRYRDSITYYRARLTRHGITRATLTPDDYAFTTARLEKAEAVMRALTDYAEVYAKHRQS